MPSFPFLRLPILIQLLILKNASLLDLFYLSLISKRFKPIVKALDSTLVNLNWDFHSFSSYHQLELRDLEGGRELCLRSLFHGNELEPDVFIPFGKLHFNGRVLSVFRRENDSCDIISLKNDMSELESLELMDQLTEHVLQLFKITKYQILLHNFPDFRDYFVWKYTKVFDSVTLTSPFIDTVITGEQAKFLMEEITADYMQFSTPVEEGFEYSGALKMKRLDVTHCTWLSLEAILNMDCQELIVNYTNFTYKDMNTIVRKWLDGGLKNLKEIEVLDFRPVLENSDSDVLEYVLEDIESFPWDVKNRPGSTCYFDFENSWDICRSDGTIATLYYENEIFVFHIWPLESASQ